MDWVMTGGLTSVQLKAGSNYIHNTEHNTGVSQWEERGSCHPWHPSIEKWLSITVISL